MEYLRLRFLVLLIITRHKNAGEINGIGHGRLIDQVRKLINEGIQTSGNRSMDFNPMPAPP
jgi:hypothetical protein